MSNNKIGQDAEFIAYGNEVPRPQVPFLSIVTPVYKNNPSALLLSLRHELQDWAKPDLADEIEFIIVDDGSKDETLTTQIIDTLKGYPICATLYSFKENGGRSSARNHLIEKARGQYLLFLDSDMLPDDANFIAQWLNFAHNNAPDIAYGGYTIKQAPITKETALARALAGKSDCNGASERNQRGALAVATSNLLVRHDIMEKVPFDCGFSGWGWEDTDWALRAQEAQYNVTHVDITATHLGLDIDKVLLDKLKKAGPNFKYILQNHPQVQSLATAKTARALSKLPFLTLFAFISEKIALCTNMPVKMRSFAARLWRALWAAKSLQNN